ncbi:MAG TPA: sigma factor, partial [Thermomonospora sp.]|nr:sigma factor [Thermomonospora sp.]
MPGTPEALYDAHAVRLHTYCWSLVGDGADDAVRDTYVAAVQHPPRGDAVLWLYALARSACLDRGALDRAFAPMAARHPDPMLRAAAGLRADHREVLVLSGGEWLDVPDIALLLD